MRRKQRFKFLIKVTGGAQDSPALFGFVRKMKREGRLRVLVGGGDQINRALSRLFPWYRIDKRIGGRYLGNVEAKMKKKIERLCRWILLLNCWHFRLRLWLRGILGIKVITPIIDGCLVDGDIYAVACCNGYDRVIIVTFSEQTKAEKRKTLKAWIADYPGKFQIVTPEDIEEQMATNPVASAD